MYIDYLHTVVFAEHVLFVSSANSENRSLQLKSVISAKALGSSSGNLGSPVAYFVSYFTTRKPPSPPEAAQQELYF